MTNEEAKNIIETIYKGMIYDELKIMLKDSVALKLDEAFKLAFKALESQD